MDRVCRLPSRVLLAFGVALAHLVAASAAHPAWGAPSLPALPAAASGVGAASPAAGAQPASPVERIKRALVTLERDGRVLGYGTILPSDGRLLTALSVVGNADAADVRYADGKVVKAKVSARDPRWDLALLVAPPPVPTEGLSASEADPTTTEVRVAVPARERDGLPRPVPVEMKGRVDAVSRSGEPLSGALEIAVRTTGSFAGAPLLDSAGRVMGVLVHACRAAAAGADAGTSPPCVPLTVGAPVTVVRGFLTRVPAKQGASPWLGIVGQAERKAEHVGVRVMAVAPDGPADQAGLRAADKTKTGAGGAGAGAGKGASGDVIVAVDGSPVDSPDGLASTIGRHSPGDSVTLLVFGPPADDPASLPDASTLRFREVTVRLAAAP